MKTELSTDRGVVHSIHVSLRTRQPMQSLERVAAVPGAGLVGCRHSKPGNARAVLLVEVETLEELALSPGEIKENIATCGIALCAFAPGARLQIGETAILEVTGPCAPCRRMDQIRDGLQADLQNRRGVNARVVIGGSIQPGDEIRLIEPSRSRNK